MSSKLIANLVVGIPYGDAGKKRWVKVGALLQAEDNNAAKGPGYIVMLDTYFNPAGVPNSGTSIALSTYWPDEKREENSLPAGSRRPKEKASLPSGRDYEDDIPF